MSKTKMKTDIKNVITNLADAFDRDLFSETKEQLEKRWFFKFDANKSAEANIYNFYDMLQLYESFCRRWEEHHHGICCVVERVRDQYLWPKIEQFAKDLNGLMQKVERGEG